MAIPMVQHIKLELDEALEKFQLASGPAQRSLAAGRVAALCNLLASAVKVYK